MTEQEPDITVIERERESDEGARYELEIKTPHDRLLRFYAGPLHDCAEDASLERDLHYAYDAVKAFKLGYEAGKAGKTVGFVTEPLE